MNEIGKWSSDKIYRIERRNLLLELGATVYLNEDTGNTDNQIVEEIGMALGVFFDEDSEGHFEELEAHVAIVLNQLIGVYKEPDYSPAPYAGKIVLVVLPRVDPFWLGMEEYVYLYVDVSDHLAALLRKNTGRPFVAWTPERDG